MTVSLGSVWLFFLLQTFLEFTNIKFGHVSSQFKLQLFSPLKFDCFFLNIIWKFSKFPENKEECDVFAYCSGGGRGLLPNFCMRVCQRDLRTHTLSLAKFMKKTPFLLHFLGETHCFSYTFCQKVPFSEQYCWKMARGAENFRELSSSNSFSVPKHPFSCIFAQKTYPFSCIFCQNHTLDVGTPAVLYI